MPGLCGAIGVPLEWQVPYESRRVAHAKCAWLTFTHRDEPNYYSLYAIDFDSMFNFKAIINKNTDSVQKSESESKEAKEIWYKRREQSERETNQPTTRVELTISFIQL